MQHMLSEVDIKKIIWTNIIKKIKNDNHYYFKYYNYIQIIYM